MSPTIRTPARTLPVYCSFCKGHISGPAQGYRGPDVSHGVCLACKEMVLAGFSIPTIRQTRRAEIEQQLQLLTQEQA